MRITFYAVVIIALAHTPLAHGQITRLGTCGDSLTDEYFEESYGSYANGWTELLVTYRGIDVGPTAARAGVPGGDWGEPRRTGFEHNWARFGATTDDLLNTGQHTGLVDSTMNGGVTHAVFFVGGNDFSPWSGPYDQIYNDFWTEGDIAFWVDGRLLNIEMALDAIAATTVSLVVVTIPDFSAMPYVWSAYPDAVRRNAVAAVIDQANVGIQQLAHDRGYPVVDMNGLTRAIFGANEALRVTLPVGGVELLVQETDTNAGENPLAGWVHDAIHPNTTVQGIWCNAIVTAFNQAYGTNIVPFTEEEILAHAGLRYGGTDTLATEIGAYADYVLLPPDDCDADLNGDGSVNVADVLQLLGAWSTPRGDLTDDGTTDVSDLLVVLAAWGSCG